MVEQQLAHRIRPRLVEREIVLEEDAARGEQVNGLGGLVQTACVEEQEVERSAARQVMAPVADNQLDVPETRETFSRDGGTIGIPLDGHEGLGDRRDRGGTLAEGSACLGTASRRRAQ